MATVTLITETVHSGEYLVSEAPGGLSREVATITGANDLFAGTVLGKITTSGLMPILNPAAADGSQNAAAILYHKATVSAGNQARTITARNAEVNGLLLTWPAGITAPQQAAAILQLAALNIIVRT